MDLLKNEIPLHSVYLISEFKEKQEQSVKLKPKQKTRICFYTYTLLIIGQKPISKSLGDFMDDLYGKMGQKCRVYIIYYALPNVKRAMDEGDNFLSRTIHKTPCLFRADNQLTYMSGSKPFFHISVYGEIKQVWDIRIQRADYLLSILNTIEPNESAISGIATMHHALEQICLGLLYLFWEFRPQHYALPYMLHLCSHFTDLPKELFPKATYGLHRMHYMLCNAHHIMRFKTGKEFSTKDADKAYNRCVRFYEQARELGEKQLKKLKALHCLPESLKT